MTFPNGTHIAEVEVDPETGLVSLERLTAVDDYGVIVNPMIAAGQAHGAIAQGAGQALLEHAVYDPESGQPVSGSFMDYAMPRAGDLPSFDAVVRGHALHDQSGRGKGCGEAGAVALFPAIANAIADAVGVRRWRSASFRSGRRCDAGSTSDGVRRGRRPSVRWRAVWAGRGGSPDLRATGPVRPDVPWQRQGWAARGITAAGLLGLRGSDGCQAVMWSASAGR